MKSKINKFFAWIIVLLLVLGLVGFGLQDVLSRWGSSKLATVGDIEISTKEFGQDFIREINFISQNLGKNLSVQEAKSIGIHFRVLERLINRSLLDQLVRDLEISIGDTFLLKRIKGNTNFQDNNGNFNRENYNQYLNQLNLSENEFEDILRNELSRELLTQILNIELDHSKFSTKKIADYINVILYFENNLTAVLNSDWISPYKEHRFSVLGSKGSLIFDDTKDWANKLIINPSYLNKEKKIIYKPEKAIEVSNEEPLKKEIETFLQCVKKNHKPITDIDEAINVQVVLDMIEKKLRENYG